MPGLKMALITAFDLIAHRSIFADKRGGPAPAVRVLVRSATASVLTGCAHRPCADVAYSLSTVRIAAHTAALA